MKKAPNAKRRLDDLVVERGIADSRERAQALIMARMVLVDEQPATKAGASVSNSALVTLKNDAPQYVSRGGLKIAGACAALGVNPSGWTCVDVGCSTGGFTHYLLLHGAARVFSVDVDVTQLDWKLRNDPRVVLVERNARFLALDDIGEPADLAVVDASFISLRLLLPGIARVLKAGGYCLAMVKPQFEVEREKVGRGGIVRSEVDQAEAVEKIVRSGEQLGWTCLGNCESPITGREGNREYFVFFQNGGAR